MKFPAFQQWKKLLQVLSSKEKIVFLTSLGLFLGSTIFLLASGYLHLTSIQPSQGGLFTEGIVGQPRWINPIYAPTNDVDRDLVELIFSGLVKYDAKAGIVPDLAQDWTISKDGLVYEFYLRKDVFWHDGKKLTADDIIFTVETIQNSDYKSPLIANWLGVKAQKISDYQVRFELKKPYGPFLEIATLKILPKHIWQNIPSQTFSLSPYNLKPIGSGPYKFSLTTQDKSGYIKSITLEGNKKYFAQKPFIPKIKFLFFETKEQLLKTAQLDGLDGFTLLLAKDLNFRGFISHSLVIPRYFAVFFNPEKTALLTQSKIRYALNYGTNKTELVETIFKTGRSQEELAEIVHSPLLPSVYGYSPLSNPYQYNFGKAQQLLEESGFQDEDGDGVREKIIKKESSTGFKSDLKRGSRGAEVKELQKCLAQDPEVYPEKEITGLFGPATQKAVLLFQEKYYKEILKPEGLKRGTGLVGERTRDKLNELCNKIVVETIPLKLSLTTANQELLVQTANVLKDQWQKLGVQIEIQALNLQQLEKDVIKKRDYELLLFGEALGSIPDLFPFWHSSQKKDPGLNLALYADPVSDKLLEEARQSLDPAERTKKYEKFQEQLLKTAPAVFLYNPRYLYLLGKKIKGVDLTMTIEPSKRFSEIESWYIKTKRKWKKMNSK